MAAVLFTLPLIGAVSVGDVLAVGASIASILLQPKPKEPTFKSMTSAWGNCIPVVYNSFRLAGNCIQAGPVTKHEEKAGPLGLGKTTAYSQTFAQSVCEGVRNIGRIWADKQVIYDPRPIIPPGPWQPDTVYGAGDIIRPTSTTAWQLQAATDGTSGNTEPSWDLANDAATRDNDITWVATPYVARKYVGQQYNFTMRIYTGTETQLPDPALEEIAGTGMQPAYRGMVYVVFENFDLSRYGNRIPNFEFEVLPSSADQFVGGAVVYGNAGGMGGLAGSTAQFLTDDAGNLYSIGDPGLGGVAGRIANAKTLSYFDLTSTQITADAVSFGGAGSYGGWGVWPIAGKYFFAAAVAGGLPETWVFVLYQINTDGSITALGSKGYISGTSISTLVATTIRPDTQEVMIAYGDFALENLHIMVLDSIAGLTGTYAARPDIGRAAVIAELNTGTESAFPAPFLGYAVAFVGSDCYVALNKAHMDSIAAHGSSCPAYAALQPTHPDGVLLKITTSSSAGIIGYTYIGVSTDFGWPFPDEGLNDAGAPGQTTTDTFDDWSPPVQQQEADGTVDAVWFVRGYSDAQTIVSLQRFDGNGVLIDSAMKVPFNPGAGFVMGEPRAMMAGDGAIYMTMFGTISSGGMNTARIGAFVPHEMTLADICADVSNRVGLAGLYDYTGLESVVPRGCAVLTRDAARKFIESLQPAFFFDLVDIGSEIQGTLRSNQTVVQTIPEADLGAAPTASQVVDKINSMRNDDKEIPQDLALDYYDFNHDYQQGSQPARRNRVTQYSSGRNTVSVPVVMMPGEARTAAYRSLYLTWVERTPRKFTLPPEYVVRTPADIVALQRSGENYYVRISKMTFQPTMVIEGESISEDLGVYQIKAPTSLSDFGNGTFTPGTINPAVPAVLAILDTAPLAAADLQTPGVYAGGAPNVFAGRFDFLNVLQSVDDSVFDLELQLASAATMGFTKTMLGNCARWTVWDNVNTVDVQLYNGVLANASKDDLVYSMANLAWIGNATAGEGELFQFTTATLIDPVNEVWRLSGLLRGRYGTEQFVGSHTGGELVVLIGTPVQTITTDVEEIGAVRYWEGMNDSPLGDTTPVQTLTMTTRRLLPFAPFFIKGSRDLTDNLTITGLRRMRWRGTPLWTPPETDTPVTMQIDILDGMGNVKRTLSSTLSANGSGITDPSAFAAYYAEADQVIDFGSAQAVIAIKAYELNAVVGRGYPGAKTL